MESKKRETETVLLRELTVQMASGLVRTLLLEPDDDLHIIEGEDEILVKQKALNEVIHIQSVYVEIYSVREFTAVREKAPPKKISETALAPSPEV